MENIKQKIEALLFIAGEPIAIKQLAKILEIKEDDISTAILALKDEYREGDRGLIIIENNSQVQLATSPIVSETIENFLKSSLKEELTPAALETLAIIAYKGPLIRVEIDNIRGVNSSFTIRNLLIRGLIEKDLDKKKANSFAYRISFDMLKKLGLENIGQLPEYEKYSAI